MIIEGLRIQDWAHISRLGTPALVRVKPFYIVFHGDTDFSHEHYGVHLGQEDHLTFIGDSNKVFWGDFLDCRRGSPTFGNRQTLQLRCSTTQTLIVPPGVAHAFRNIHGVFTLNNYELFLPPVELLTSGEFQWDVESDVLNVPLTCSTQDVPRLEPNSEAASDLLFEIIASSHRAALINRHVSYPIVQEMPTADRGHVRIRFTPRHSELKMARLEGMWEELSSKIQGGKLHRHLRVMSGDDSGVLILPYFASSVYVITSPFKSLRNAIDMPNEEIFVTFFSNKDIELCIFEEDINSTALHISGNGLFEFEVDDRNDVEIRNGGCYAIVRVGAAETSISAEHRA